MASLVLRVLAVFTAAVAAYAWFRSAAVSFLLLSGAAIGGTSPSEPFNLAVKQSGLWNERAAIMTSISVLFSAAAEVMALIDARNRTPKNRGDLQ